VRRVMNILNVALRDRCTIDADKSLSSMYTTKEF
jgi:hypothetical protein